MKTLLLLALSVFSLSPLAQDFLKLPAIEDDEVLITLVGTNDIHGDFLAKAKGQTGQGGMDLFASYLKNLRQHLESKYKDRHTFVLLDAGDTFQGSLLSNMSEGQLGVALMNELGYNAAILGNHGFDFGPLGEKQDKCATNVPCDSLEAIRAFVSMSKFPFLASNVLDRGTGKRPDFLRGFEIVNVFGHGLAILGLENPLTDRLTVPENVQGLQFTEGIKEIQETVEALFAAGRADLFVLVAHEGDTQEQKNLANFLAKLPKRSDGAPLIQAVIAGHSHQINQNTVQQIPYIQSQSDGRSFGVISLVAKIDMTSKKLRVDPSKTFMKAAIPITFPAMFMGKKIEADKLVSAMLRKAVEEVDLVAKKRLAKSSGVLTYAEGRRADSLVGNWIADAMRSASKSQVAVINSGDIRDGLPAGDILFEHLFNVVPKNLELIRVAGLPTELLIKNLERSIRTCGRRGALQVSGLKLYFSRNCQGHDGDEDREAKLIRVRNREGELIFEKGKIFKEALAVATTDFMLAGGAGYPHFVGLKNKKQSFILRDVLVRDLEARTTLVAEDFTHGRYHNCLERSVPDCE